MIHVYVFSTKTSVNGKTIYDTITDTNYICMYVYQQLKTKGYKCIYHMRQTQTTYTCTSTNNHTSMWLKSLTYNIYMYMYIKGLCVFICAAVSVLMNSPLPTRHRTNAMASSSPNKASRAMMVLCAYNYK